VQEMLGHATVSQTMDTFSHVLKRSPLLLSEISSDLSQNVASPTAKVLP